VHTAIVLLVVAGWALGGKLRADQLRAASDPHRLSLYSSAILAEWLILGLVLWGAPLRLILGESWDAGGRWLRDVAIAAAFWILSALAITGLRLALHIPSLVGPIRFMVPHNGPESVLWVALSISAGICEEAIFRGYLQRQFSALTDSVPAGVALSAAAFGAGHAYQGFRPVILLTAYGALFGLQAHWRRSLRPGMLAHAWQDSLAGLVLRDAG
jgi:membrane protease YdiL (CAAX protease family)